MSHSRIKCVSSSTLSLQLKQNRLSLSIGGLQWRPLSIVRQWSLSRSFDIIRLSALLVINDK